MKAVIAVTDDERVDLQRMATQDGTTLEQAAADFDWQNDFALLATEIEDRHPDGFAGAAVVDAAQHRASIAFTGGIPFDVEEQVASIKGYSVDLDGERAHSVRELDELLIAVHRSLARREDLVDEVISSYEVTSGEITSQVRPTAAAAGGVEPIADLLRAGLPIAASRWPVRIAVDADVAATTEVLYGGGRIEESGSNALNCAAGFSVSSNTGYNGVSTAGHCANSATFENSSGATEYSLSFRAQHRGAWGDFQWHTNSETESDDFYYDFSLRRDTTATASPVLNQRICCFGQASGAECANVDDLSLCVTYGDYDTCRLVKMDRDTAIGGDSGGPWYYGNTAYGVHTGQVDPATSGPRDTWSRVRYMDDALGLTVLT